jgi:hypothetical protein
VSVLFAKPKPTPPKVVVWSLPVLSAERRVFVAMEKIVEELKVAVALCAVDELKVAVELNVWLAVQVTEEAFVTNPGFVKPRVTEPVAWSTVTPPPPVSAVTPVFIMEKVLEEVETWMPVEAFREMVPVRLPKEFTPETVPVAPLNEAT